jgi:hypothetical protein
MLSASGYLRNRICFEVTISLWALRGLLLLRADSVGLIADDDGEAWATALLFVASNG